LPWSSSSDPDLEKHLIDKPDAVSDTKNTKSDDDSLHMEDLYKKFS
jgi:hypothetical protein